MSADGKRNAKAVGKRTSAEGNVYYETRPNRSDKVTNKVKKEKLTPAKKVAKLKSLAKKGKAK